MVGRYGKPVWIECECGKKHLVLEAEAGEIPVGAPRLWHVVRHPVEGWMWPDEHSRSVGVSIPVGTRLRYDQRDFDSTWHQEGWDRFRVLDGPLAGTCVYVSAGMPGGHMADGIAPVTEAQDPTRSPGEPTQ